MADLLYLMGFLPNVDHREFQCVEEQLHVTVLPSFSVKTRDLDELVRRLDQIVTWFKAPKLYTTDIFLVGEDRNIPAMKVTDQYKDCGRSLKELHLSMCETVDELGGWFNAPHFTREGYTPHVSHCSERLAFQIDELILVHHTGGFGIGVETIGTFKFDRT